MADHAEVELKYKLPEIAILHAGGNDLANGSTTDDIASNLSFLECELKSIFFFYCSSLSILSSHAVKLPNASLHMFSGMFDTCICATVHDTWLRIGYSDRDQINTRSR